MNGNIDLTNFKNEANDLHKIYDAVIISVAFLIVCWGIFICEEWLGFHLKQYGLRPRDVEGLAGIFSMHFLHADLKHISHNSLGYLVLNSFLFYFYREIAWRVWGAIFLIAPLLLWIAGRDSNHIGASLLIYGLFSFVAISGFVRRNPPLLRVAFVVVAYYGSLVWYLFPIEPRISFEGHASGFLVGFIAAVWLRKKGPQRKLYRFETEPELPDDENAYWKTTEKRSEHAPSKSDKNEVKIHYHFKPSNDEEPHSKD